MVKIWESKHALYNTIFTGKSLLEATSQDLFLEPLKKAILYLSSGVIFFLKEGEWYFYMCTTPTMNSFSPLTFAAKLICFVMDTFSLSVEVPGWKQQNQTMTGEFTGRTSVGRGVLMRRRYIEWCLKNHRVYIACCPYLEWPEWTLLLPLQQLWMTWTVPLVFDPPQDSVSWELASDWLDLYHELSPNYIWEKDRFLSSFVVGSESLAIIIF